MKRFAPGEVVVVQEVWDGRLWAARPVRVVRDDGDELLLWCPKGTVRKVPDTPPGRPKPPTRPEWFADLLARDWQLVDAVWDVSTLWVVRDGDWHAVWVTYRDDDSLLGWYVNLQEPFARTVRGIRTMDLMLDVVADAQRSWRWKDEDDFAILLERGLLDEATGRRVREAAEVAVAALEAAAPPFDDTWTAWRPDPAWPLPELPPGWDRL